LKFSSKDDTNSSHMVYLKKYRSEKKSLEKPIGKTLVVYNIPPYATQDSISRVFSTAGPIEKLTLTDCHQNEKKTKYQIPSQYFNDPLPFKFLIAFVVYKKSSSLDAALKFEKLPALSTEEDPVLTGVAKWTAEYNKRSIDTEDMQKEIDEYMKHYDKVKKAEEMQENAEDDEGWVTVGKKGHNAGFSQNEVIVNKLEQKLASQRKKAKHLKNFYAFEFKDNKKKQLIELRRKFEEDKDKMNAMRLNRKFKPY
jgi:ribosomal RNA-processing protein 7